jgi:excisionase family DNA binding protein
MAQETEWLSTAAAAKRIGITPRTLYRFIDEGQLPAYRMGRVIRLKTSDVDDYIESCRIEPGTMSHLYPETVSGSARDADEDTEGDNNSENDDD